MMTRFMTSNAWADVFGNPVPGRDTNLMRIVDRYMPDCIFFQEFHPSWHKSDIKPYLNKKGYIEAKPELNGNEYNYTPLFYSEKFRELKSGFVLFKGLNDYTSKSLTYAVLEDKSGKRFFAGATHLYFEDNQAGNEARLGNVREILGEVGKYADGMPVFIGGDLNCDLRSEPYMLFEENGFTDSFKIAEEKENPVTTYHDAPKFKDGIFVSPACRTEYDTDASIDHIIVRKETKINKYCVDISLEARSYSDHYPVIVDAVI